ncbi:penicillin acylase family protein [Ferrimonas balearica]|uniref:penicillin acylase family protein n=1 Tax=Ferrimonas balearica TaxID=44012 RepID=UPI001C99E6AC|nr:penicillin acylase family protein [Ferrimonas balearica]MBY5991278.1 penicillin acylase family protein [Ferrimonas balearica]
MVRWFGGLAAILVVALAALMGLLWHQQPQYQGTQVLAGLNEAVQIRFDEYGVPSVQASSDEDALVALGWLHVQERLFQMDLLRRVGKGELSALFGPAALDTDRLFRTLGTRHWAQQQVSLMSATEPQLARWLEAYYQGVNQAIATLPTPLEYKLLGTKPEPFSAVDTFATLSYMAHSFTSAFKQDPMMTALLAELAPQYHHALVSGWPDHFTPELAPSELHAWHRAADNLDALLPMGRMLGSNGWVLSAERSTGEAPLFANDPHISFSTPQVWYEAQLHTPSRALYGYYLPGLPLPLLGRTPERAWGLTMLLNDDADLYRLTASDGGYRLDGDTLAYQVREERIPVKGAEDEHLEVLLSVQGPRVDQVLALPEPTALLWTFTDTRNRPLSGLFQLLHADGIRAFEQALDPIWSPGVNVLYGDVEGNIAKWAVARYLHRADGVSGAQIIDGSLSATLPVGYHPFEVNPRFVNPESGLVFSANHPYGPPWDELERAGYYAPRFRPETLEQALAERNQWDIAGLKRVQNDSRNGRYLALKPLLLASVPPSPERDIIARWDGRYRPDSAAPTLMEAFYQALLEATLADELGEALFDALQGQSLVDKIMAEVLAHPDSPWWDHRHSDSVQGPKEIARAAWTQALAALPRPIPLWREQGLMRHRHAMAQSPLLAQLLQGPGLPISGSKRAINNMAYRYGADQPVATFGPSTRRLVDLAQPEQGHVIAPLGQSGVPFSPHFADQAEAYGAGDYRVSALSPPGPESDLVLIPQ